MHSTSSFYFLLLSIFIIYESEMHSMKRKFITTIFFFSWHSNESKTITKYDHIEKWKWKRTCPPDSSRKTICLNSLVSILHQRASFFLPIANNRAAFTWHNQMKWNENDHVWKNKCALYASVYKDLLDKTEQFNNSKILQTGKQRIENDRWSPTWCLM